MSNFGQAVLTVGGTVVGGMFGAPQLGYLLGSLAGQAAFPTQLPTARGPKLEDAKIQTSALGAPIPWVWGTYILAGQVIWRSPFLERKVKEKAGGKGGPEQTSIHFEYRVNVAIGLCKGPIVGIRRIWADTKLIYDASSALDDTDPPEPEDFGDGFDGLVREAIARAAASKATEAHFDLYTGTEVQTADPTIETYEGVGNVPGYRGLAYIVFRDFELAEYGNRIPNFRVEVMTEGTVGATDLDIYSNDVVYPWNDGFTRDPRNPLNTHKYWNGYTQEWVDTVEESLAGAEALTGRPYIADLLWHWSKSSTPNTISWCDGEDAQDRLNLYLYYNSLNIHGDTCVNPSCAWILAEKGAGVVFHARKDFYVVTEPGIPESFYFGGYSEPGATNCGGGHFKEQLSDHGILVARTRQPPDGCSGLMAVPGADGFCVTSDGVVVPEITWTLTAGDWHVLRKYADNGNRITSYPLNPARPSTHAQYNDQAFWEAAYAEAVANGDIEAGLTYGVDYPQTQAYGYVGSMGGTFADPDPVPLSDIVADICEGCGLTSYDVSDLASVMVHGYALTGPTTGKDGIEPLRPFGYFDAVESELDYKFVRRGHASVMTIDADDMSARLHTEEHRPALTTNRAQDPELPRLVRAHFIDIARDGDPGQAEQQRQTVDSVNTLDVQVPVVMPQARGQAMADTVLFERWIGRNTYQFALPFKYVPLEPTDCILVPKDDGVERMRITRQEARALAVIEFTAVRDDQSSYGGTDIVGDNTGGSTIPIGGVPSPTDLVLLELPSLRSQDTDCGYYAAARGLLAGWPGAVVYRATSPSGTFRQVAWTSIAATMGYVTETVGADTLADSGVVVTGTVGVTDGIDQSTVIRVHLYSGSFESISEDDLLAGENLIAVGDEGDWELIRFQLAVQGSDGDWELSGLLREQFGTTRRDILEGERVVLMTGPGIMRIDESSSAQGVSRVLRAVTSGTSLEDAEDHYITTTCLSRPATADPTSSATSVLSRSIGTAPVSPSCDDAYLVIEESPPLEEGDTWFGHVNEIARWDCVTLAWVFTTPTVGTLIYVEDDATHVYWNGSAYLETIPDLDQIVGSSTHGDILYRGSTAWARLPAGTAGQFLRTAGAGAAPAWAGVLTGGGGFASSVQASDLVITNNDVFQDTDISIPLSPGTYAFESFYEAIVDATPDMTVRLIFTGTESQFAALRSFARGTTPGTEQTDAQPYGVSYTVTATGVTTTTGTIVVTAAGDLKIQAKQNTSSATAVTFSKGSWLRVSQLA